MSCMHTSQQGADRWACSMLESKRRLLGSFLRTVRSRLVQLLGQAEAFLLPLCASPCAREARSISVAENSDQGLGMPMLFVKRRVLIRVQCAPHHGCAWTSASGISSQEPMAVESLAGACSTSSCEQDFGMCTNHSLSLLVEL